MYRLTWRCGPQKPIDWDETLTALSAERNLAVFCDNSAFDDGMPPELWEVLLSGPGRLVLTERVIGELRPWLKKRLDHPVAAAIRDDHSGLGERKEPRPGESGRRVFDYYMALLVVRRDAVEILRRRFRQEHGRDPRPDEDRALADEVQKDLGQRGRLIATKPAGSFTDEALVYLAVEHALSTGRQTLILTRDADVEEQFFKLLWLVDTHYRGMLLADSYIERFGTYRTYPVLDSVLDDPNGPFEPHDALIIERDLHLLDVLPKGPHCVGISCLNAGVYGCQLSFMAETEMARLLRIKDETGGLSTDRLQGRNMHASIVPIRVGGTEGCGAMVFDRRLPVGSTGVSVAKLDVAQALIPCEQHASLVPVAASPGPWVGR